jgi:hypothetical protein
VLWNFGYFVASRCPKQSQERKLSKVPDMRLFIQNSISGSESELAENQSMTSSVTLATTS